MLISGASHFFSNIKALGGIMNKGMIKNMQNSGKKPLKLIVRKKLLPAVTVAVVIIITQTFVYFECLIL